jgi:hypothetical protein
MFNFIDDFKYNEDCYFRKIKPLLDINNDDKLPLCKFLRNLIINNHSIFPHQMKYHDAAIIASSINRYFSGLTIDGGFVRDMFKFGSIYLKSNNPSVDKNQYILNDIDFHLDCSFEFDVKQLISDEYESYFIFNSIKNILNNFNCNITNKIIQLRKHNPVYSHDITLYNLDVQIGNDKSEFDEFVPFEKNSVISVQIILSQNNKYNDFVCNQLFIINNNYSELTNEPLLGIKKQSKKFFQKYINIWKNKIILYFNKSTSLPSHIISIILSFLNLDINHNISYDNRFNAFSLNKNALSRTSFTSKMTIDNIMNQLSHNTTFFIGDCNQTGCVPKTIDMVINIKTTDDLFLLGDQYQWDQFWSIYKNRNILDYRIQKLNFKKINILNICKNNNRQCLWFKNNKLLKLKQLYYF